MFIEEQIRLEYDSKSPLYYELGEILQSQINDLLKEKEISYDYVQMRIKSFVSFFEKIDRNSKWQNPFEEIEDFCGLRIIHLFDDDLETILEILRNRFHVLKEDNPTKIRPQTEKEFTYRSYHIFLKPKENIIVNPALKGLFAEVQIRTICMHAWATIEHKLNYKQQKSIPAKFRPFINRKFSQMSAVLEIADNFFVSLRNEKIRTIKSYKTKLTQDKTKNKILNNELNIDVLQAYLENKFPKLTMENKIDKNKKLKYLLNEMLSTRLTLKNIEDGESMLTRKNIFPKLVNEYPSDKPTQTGMARLILDSTNDEFYKMRNAKLTNSKWIKFVDSIREQLNK